MNGPVGLELRKMRRLRTMPILVGLVVAVAALSSASLFSSTTQQTLTNPTATPWAALLLSYTLIAAMTSPILTAVLASRQTDIEHTGSGWILAASAGRTPGSLCRAKLVALALLLHQRSRCRRSSSSASASSRESRRPWMPCRGPPTRRSCS